MKNGDAGRAVADPWKPVVLSILVQVRLSPEQHERVVRMAMHRNCAVAEVVRSALAHYERTSPDVAGLADGAVPARPRRRSRRGRNDAVAEVAG